MRPIETHHDTTKAMHQLQVSFVPLRTLRRSQRNMRTHSKKQIKQIANSILGLGFTNPLLVDENLNIIAGHGRFEAATSLGLSQVPVIIIGGLTDPQKRALAIADNKIAANANWDRSMLAVELGELATLLPEINLDISVLGFEPAEIDALAVDLSDPEQEPLDEVPSTAESTSVTQMHDLWKLGDHRLLCGDACDDAALQTLMSADLASMLFADPPYNVRIAKVVGRGKIKHREFITASGEKSSAQFVEFLKTWMRLAVRYSEESAISYICMDWRHSAEMLDAGSSIYRALENIAVWVKSTPGQGSFYRSAHEFVFIFKNGDVAQRNNIQLGKHGRNRSNVWMYPGANAFRAGRLDELRMHPTVKPVALVADAMRDCTRRGEIVLDPFMGSGTTILAAERIGRGAYGLEIDPLYVDVSVRRWQAFTGRDAVLESTGQTFDEIADHGRARTRRRAR